MSVKKEAGDADDVSSDVGSGAAGGQQQQHQQPPPLPPPMSRGISTRSGRCRMLMLLDVVVVVVVVCVLSSSSSSSFFCHAFSPLIALRHTTSTTTTTTTIDSNSNRRSSVALATVSKMSAGSLSVSTTTKTDNHKKDNVVLVDNCKLLIHWKGDINDGYSFHLRHVEFQGALEAVSGIKILSTSSSSSSTEEAMMIQYQNALQYNHDNDDGADNTDEDTLPDHLRLQYDESMQYLQIYQNNNNKDSNRITMQHVMDAANRCSLIHAVYQIVAIADSYTECAQCAMANDGFRDMYHAEDDNNDNNNNNNNNNNGMKVHNMNQDATWCLRVRDYKKKKTTKTDKKVKRHGERARSMEEERKALQDMKPLFLKLGGKVNMKNADCYIYVFQGLKGNKTVLTRRIASGPSIYTMAPATRICITNTPLCPIAAFTLCNIAGIRNETSCTVLDPFAGSCATLLAAAMMAPACQTVAIDIQHNGIINRHAIMQDFLVRNLTAPLALLWGDATEKHDLDEVRIAAREEIDGQAFDIIVTDPPYGIRESLSPHKNDNNNNNEIMTQLDPLSELFLAMAHDYDAGTPLLRKGGKLVAFIPCTDEQDIHDLLPSHTLADRAGGLVLLDQQEQPLNDKLSRWLVSYQSTK